MPKKKRKGAERLAAAPESEVAVEV